MGRHIDLKNQQFGELTAISYNPGTKTNHSTWTCKCNCGNEIKVPGYALRNGNYKSCGCKQIEKRDEGVKKHIAKDQTRNTRITALTSKVHKDSTSGVKGVSWVKSRNKWTAYITLAGKTKKLGYFKDKQDAIKARLLAEEEYFKPILEEKENDKNN